MLYVDIPTLPEFRALHASRADACVSLFLPTTPQTQDVSQSRIAFGNLARAALDQLETAGFDKRRRARLEAEFAALGEDDDFWRLQANSLAVLATPDGLRTFRLATAVAETVQVADRFHLKPLLRAIAFPQYALVLALSENAVRLIEVSADLEPATIRVPNLPESAADAVGRASVNNLTQGTRIANAEGQTVLLKQYARKVDAALRPVLSGRDVPLILAASAPLAPIFRAACSYPALLSDGISASPDHLSAVELGQQARSVLDGHYAGEVAAARHLYESRQGARRSTTELSTIARAATFGAIDTLLVDIDEDLPGTIDETEGSVLLAEQAGPSSYGVIDEIAGRAIVTGAKVLAVRRGDIPEEALAAAVLRYPI